MSQKYINHKKKKDYHILNTIMNFNSADSLRLKLGWHILTYEIYTQMFI